jgi:hypothetical protein
MPQMYNNNKDEWTTDDCLEWDRFFNVFFSIIISRFFFNMIVTGGGGGGEMLSVCHQLLPFQ